jgi:hypothetical protein
MAGTHAETLKATGACSVAFSDLFPFQFLVLDVLSTYSFFFSYIFKFRLLIYKCLLFYYKINTIISYHTLG